MSGAESVSTMPERTCRRICPKTTQTLTAPLLKPQNDRLITNKKYVMAILTVLQCFNGIVMCRHFFNTNSNKCVSYRRPLTSQCWIVFFFLVFIRTNSFILFRGACWHRPRGPVLVEPCLLAGDARCSPTSSWWALETPVTLARRG